MHFQKIPKISKKFLKITLNFAEFQKSKTETFWKKKKKSELIIMNNFIDKRHFSKLNNFCYL